MFNQQALVHEMGNLRKFALRLTRNTSEADDLVQSTLLRALEKKEYFQEDTNLFSWTSKIMFNLFVTRYRQKKKFESQFDPEPHINHVAQAPAQEMQVDLSLVRSCMNRLSAEHREMLILVCINGMKYEEVSEHLHIPVGTVRSRLSRARSQLQELLDTPQQMPRRRMPPTQVNAKRYSEAA